MTELQDTAALSGVATPGWFGIAGRLAIGSALPLLLFLTFTVWLWGSLGQVRDNVQNTLTLEVDYALQAKDLQRNVVQVQQFLSDISATRALDGLADGFAQAQKNREEFLTGLDRFATLRQNRQATAQVAALQTVRRDFDHG